VADPEYDVIEYDVTVWGSCPPQWRAEVWWCPGRLFDWIPPYQILVLRSGVWWSLLLDIRCLWRHNVTSYSGLQSTFWRSLLTQHVYLAAPEQR